MPRTSDNNNENDEQSSRRVPSGAQERSVDGEPDGETGVAVERVHAPEDSSDDDNLGSGDGVGLNPS